MPSYKLSYFPGRGLGEVSRQLFHISGTPFEDDRVTMEEWPKHKESTPFGQMPVLYVDGQPLPQSFAIARYLAKQFGFAGQTPYEVAWVDALADQYKDYYQEIKPFLMVAFGFAQGDKEKLAKEVAEPAIKKFFSILEKNAWDAGLHGHFHGYFVGDSLTWIDLVISDHIDVLEGHLSNPIAEYPLVQEVRDKTISHPKLKQWLAKRPVTLLPFFKSVFSNNGPSMENGNQTVLLVLSITFVVLMTLLSILCVVLRWYCRRGPTNREQTKSQLPPISKVAESKVAGPQTSSQ